MARYKFDQIAFNSTDKKKPTDEDKEHYIGLEHLDSGGLQVTRWGSEIAPKGEKLLMKKGDVLFGKRRAYQKKVAIAPFDGIFSAHGMVLRPRRDVIDAEFFPLFIASDYFLDAAIKISVGSLSPTINWRDLKELEFELPSIPAQQKLAKVLWAINYTKGAYEQLIKETDELVKSQFMEQFGGSEKYKTEPLSSNVDEMFIGPFGSALKNNCFVDADQAYCMVYEQKHAIQKTMTVETRYVDESKYKELQRFTILPGDIIVSCRGTIGEVFLVPEGAPMGIMHPSIMKIRLKDQVYNKTFFLFVLEKYMKEHIAEANGTGVKMAVTATALGKEQFIVPPMSVQEEWMSFVRQSDKSKFELNEAIKDLDAMYKRIIKDNLG